MMTAQILCTQLGGRWYGRYGAAPCPACQPERRKGQNALTIRMASVLFWQALETDHE
jgi:hypothetical protein